MGDIVKFERRANEPASGPAAGRPAAVTPITAPAATVFAAGLATAYWWGAAWAALLGLGVQRRPAPPTPACPTTLLRVHTNAPRVSPEALAPARRST